METNKVISFIFFHFLLLCYSYSQQVENKIIITPFMENCNIKNDCEVIDYKQYSSFVLYVCSREKVVYNPLIQDTLIVVFDLKIRLSFTDSITYFTIDQIDKISSLPILFGKDKYEENKFIRECVFQIMNDSKFYYEGDKYELNQKSFYITMPLMFIGNAPNGTFGNKKNNAIENQEKRKLK